MSRTSSLPRVVLALSVWSSACNLRSGDADDGPAPDALPPPDADPNGCPVRTAPPGEPQDLIPAAETYVGDIYLEDEDDIAMLAGIRMVQGSVFVPDGHVDDIRDVVLPDVEVITGDLRILSNYGPIRSITTPKLETVGGAVWLWRQLHGGFEYRPLEYFTAPRLDSIGAFSVLYTRTNDLACLRIGDIELLEMSEAPDLPRFEQGSLILADYSVVEVLHLPRLTGSLWLAYLPQLTTVEAPNAIEIHAEETPLLSSIDVSDVRIAVSLDGPMALPGIGFIGGAEVTSLWLHEIQGVDDAGLQALDLGDHLIDFRVSGPDVHVVDLQGPTIVDQLSLQSMPGLESVSLGTVESVGYLYVDANDALSAVTAPALTALTGIPPEPPALVFRDNPHLPYADIQAIVTAVTPNSPGLITIISCNQGGPCEP